MNKFFSFFVRRSKKAVNAVKEEIVEEVGDIIEDVKEEAQDVIENKIIDIDKILDEVNGTSDGAQVTLAHRLIYTMSSKVVESILQRCLWRLHSLGETKHGAEKAIMELYRNYKKEEEKE